MTLKQLPLRPKILILLLPLLLVLLLLLSDWVFKPQDLRIANLKERSLSATWLSQRSSKHCAWLLGPVAQGSLTTRIQCSQQAGRAHLVNFDQLVPESSYRIFIFGFQGMVLSDAVTATTLPLREEVPPLPQPGYGTVTTIDGEVVPQALVLIYTQTNDTQYPLAALTNDEGTYALSLANLNREGGSYVLQATNRPGVKTQLQIDIRFSTPFPPIVLESM